MANGIKPKAETISVTMENIFGDNMVIYIENPKGSNKKLFRNQYKILIWKLLFIEKRAVLLDRETKFLKKKNAKSNKVLERKP